VRVAAARALWSQGFIARDEAYDVGLEALVRFLKEPNAQVRLAAARALHEIVKGPMPISERAYKLAAIAEPALKEALKDPDPAVRAEAAEALKHQFVRPVRRWDGSAEPAESR
jgi:HEAT repeat protein